MPWRRKLAAMGALVAVTGGFAFFAALFSLTSFMHVFMPLAALLAVGWSLAIMSLDRYFVMAIRRDTSRGRTVLLTLPRVAIAVIAGAVVATPITLWLFGAEVTRLAEEEKVQSIRTGQLLLSRKYAEVPELERRVLALGTAGVVAGSSLGSNSAYSSLRQESARLQEQEQAAWAAASAERGGYGGTHHAGAGPIYEEKQRAAEKLGAEARAAEQKANELRVSILSEERQRASETAGYDNRERASLESLLAQLRKERAAGESVIADSRKAPIGLADRLDALTNLGRQHAAVGTFSRLIGLLILLIDSAPALAKLLMVLGPPSLYEQEVERADAAVAEENEHTRNTELEAHKLDCDRQFDIHYRRAAAEATKIDACRPVIEAEAADAGWRETIARTMKSLVAGEERRVDRYIELHNARADEEFEHRLRDAQRPPRATEAPRAPAPPTPGRETGMRRRRYPGRPWGRRR
jgi:hypothetical protein